MEYLGFDFGLPELVKAYCVFGFGQSEWPVRLERHSRDNGNPGFLAWAPAFAGVTDTHPIPLFRKEGIGEIYYCGAVILAAETVQARCAQHTIKIKNPK
jgi:hypothetical protein